MALSILNNISALTAQNQLSITQKSLQTTLTQLSSGLKINSGADDAAGLSIANGMQANIAALTQSAQNATNGTGLLQTADGALSQITNLLNRAVTLATEASNGGLNATQSTALNTEFQSILNEISSIGTTTTFNGAAIFKAGTVTNYSEVQGGSGLTASTAIKASNLDLTLGGTTLSGYTGSVATTIKASATVGDLIKNINDNSATLKVSASLTSDGKLVLDDTTKSGTSSSKFAMAGLEFGSDYTATQSSKTVVVMGSNLDDNSLIDTSNFAATFNGTAVTLAGADKAASMTVAAFKTALAADTGSKLTAAIVGGQLQITTSDATSPVAGLDVTGIRGIISGANTNDNVSQVFQSDSTTAGQSVINTVLNQLDSSHLNGVDLSKNDLTSTTNAQAALTQINTAIGAVAALRGNIGANINQLSAAASVMSTQSQNLKSAMSGITDADVATTVANMTKYNILQSTGMAALQQANQSQQSVLKLLQ